MATVIKRNIIKEFVPKEDDEQIRFSSWLTKKGIRHTASANGTKRSLLLALKLKRMGLSSGFPDVEIPYAKGGYHGLYIEMKRIKGGRLSDAQQDWLTFLNGNGYYAVSAKGCDEAIEIVLHYFSLGLTTDSLL